MRQIAEEACAPSMDAHGLNTTSTELGESAAMLQHQFGGQLERYDARINHLQSAISDAAKQMALGHNQPQTQLQPDNELSQSQRRVVFSPERSPLSPSSRPLSPTRASSR